VVPEAAAAAAVDSPLIQGHPNNWDGLFIFRGGLTLERVLFWAVVALLIWSPIPLGSNRPWAWMVIEVGIYGVLSVWLLLWAARRVELSEAARGAWPAWIALTGWVVWQAIHVIPMPRGLLAVLSPEAAHLEALVEDADIVRSAWTLSIEPHASRVSLLKTVAYAALFFLILNLANRRSRLGTLASVLVYAAVAQSVYAVMLHLAGVRMDYFSMPLYHDSSASGTYVNRNHLAGYLEMTLAIGIGLLIASLSERSADGWKQFARMTIEWILSPKMILRLSLCVLVIALTTTHSRMGNSAFFSSLLIAGVLGIALSRRATRNTVLLLASLVVIDLFIVGSWFGVEKLAQRIEQTTVQDVQDREDPAAYSLELIRHYPVFGSGPGTFYVAFPKFRQEKVTAFFEHAHNDYAEFASESGLLGLGLLGVFVITSLGAALAAQWQRRDPLMRGIAFASVMGITALLIHSWVDFNLQIPANAMLFVVLCAFGWIALCLDRRERSEAPVRASET
jgi:putative inorganic carbon (HCO3(-)) transporter